LYEKDQTLAEVITDPRSLRDPSFSAEAQEALSFANYIVRKIILFILSAWAILLPLGLLIWFLRSRPAGAGAAQGKCFNKIVASNGLKLLVPGKMELL